jgi:hypothetical protein
MKRTFTASITPDGAWWIAQCLEVDVASQGKTEEEALSIFARLLHSPAPCHAPPHSPTCGPLRSRSTPPGPLPDDEVKRRSEVANFTEASKRSSPVNVTRVDAGEHPQAKRSRCRGSLVESIRAWPLPVSSSTRAIGTGEGQCRVLGKSGSDNPGFSPLYGTENRRDYAENRVG